MASTFTASQAAAGVQPKVNSGAGLVHCAYGLYAVATNVVVNDVFQMCKLPRNSLLVGGDFLCSDIDTNGTETLEIDIGWADNGGASATYVDSAGVTWTNMFDGSADPDGLVNSDVLIGDAVTNLIAVGNWRPFLLTGGPIYFSEETMIQGKGIAVAATFTAGTIYTRCYYLALAG